MGSLRRALYTFRRVTRLPTPVLAISLLCAAHAPATAIPETGDNPTILVSRQLLAARGLSVGDVVSLSASPDGSAPRAFRIAGVYEPTADPMKITAPRLEARLHLPDLIALTATPGDPLDPESVTAINVSLHDPRGASVFARDLRARLPALIVRPTTAPETDSNPFPALERFHQAIAIVTVIGSTAFLLALMVMRAEERSETVGILRLVGFSKSRILIEVLVEGLIVALAGAVFGVLFAAATQGLVNQFFQWRYDTTLVFVRVTAGIAWRCVALAVPLGVLAGLVASWSLLRRDIVALLRR